MRAINQVRQHYTNYQLKSGVFHFSRGEHQRAAEFLTRVLTESKDLSSSDRRAAQYYLVQTRIGAASKFESQGEIGRAVEQYERALEVMPGYADVHARLGEALCRQEKYQEAVAQFQKALDVNPEYFEARLSMAHALLASGCYDDAQLSFRRALESRRTSTQSKIELAEKALSEGRRDDAAALYQDAFRTDMARFRRYFDEGVDALRDEKWEDAVGALDRAAMLCPLFADVHNYLGVAQCENGEIEPALRSFRKSVEINPHYLVAWLNLAYTAYEVDEMPSVREALATILEREPDNAPALHLQNELAESSRRNASSRTLRTTQGRS